MVGLSCWHGAAAAAPQTVGVVDFYAPTPLGGSGTVVPERYAADDLTRLLARASANRFTIVPRAAMAQAETSLRWRGPDVLDFGRLGALARAVGATTLVVGWIPLFVVNAASGGSVPPDDGDLPAADVNLVVQVFDAGQSRLTAETRQRGSLAAGLTRELLTEGVLDQALSGAVAPVVAGLTAAP